MTKEQQAYKNGKIAGMMIAAICIQDFYTDRIPRAFEIREKFSRKCQEQGFDMYKYLSNQDLIPPTPQEKDV